MSKNRVVFISGLTRVIGAAAAVVVVSAIGCVGAPDTDEGPAGEAESALTQWGYTSTASTRDFTGVPLPTGYPNCVLAGLKGNFNWGTQGGSFGGQWGKPSEAGVSGTNLLAHGGRITAYVGPDPWQYDDNMVGAAATCFTSVVHEVASGDFGFLAASAPGRQCFLRYMQAVDGAFGSSGDYVWVHEYTTTDANHPKKGWYFEGRLDGAQFGHTGAPLFEAVCYDFPVPQENATYSVYSAPGQYATSSTFATTAAACGLTAIGGAFTSNDLTKGVYLDKATATSVWKLHAYGGQWGMASCLDW